MNAVEEKKYLRSEINGLGLNRGELYLTLDELRWIQLEISSEYGFVISPASFKSQKNKKSRGKSGNESEIKGSNESTTQYSNKKQRTNSGSAKLQGSSLSNDNCEERSVFSHLGGSDTHYEGKLTRQSLNMRNNNNNDLVENKVTESTNKKISNIDLSNLKLIDFKHYSLNLLDKLSKNTNARWFLQPVDPELDGVPDYFSIIENPMDFQTIREKLVQNMYKNPFKWQLDMRLVFYNALKYHKEKNTVRQDALSLAIEFENKCRDIKEVNPYYYSLHMENEVDLLSDDGFTNELKNKLSLFNEDILIKIYRILINNYDKKCAVNNKIDIDIEVSPELIIESLKDKSDIFQEQIILLIDMIINLIKKNELINNGNHGNEINDLVKTDEVTSNSNYNIDENHINITLTIKENKLKCQDIIQDDENIAMTPSSDECSDLEENSIKVNTSKKNDNYYKNESNYSINEKDESSREGNINNSDFNSSEDQDGLYSHGSSKEILNSSFSNNSFSIPPQESAWGEWKAKVIQDSTVAQRENAPKKSKREREAEQADAEI
ncbi:bromodomain protein [Cryptosporidium bovis]|uniref:bromodomain protein n=1 Tax=Cryptosporidium bovis TaxID=310047 RepID=UPI00351AA7EB|nr:bromodomain protein [Cryptosporidium bovis]